MTTTSAKIPGHKAALAAATTFLVGKLNALPDEVAKWRANNMAAPVLVHKILDQSLHRRMMGHDRRPFGRSYEHGCFGPMGMGPMGMAGFAAPQISVADFLAATKHVEGLDVWIVAGLVAEKQGVVRTAVDAWIAAARAKGVERPSITDEHVRHLLKTDPRWHALNTVYTLSQAMSNTYAYAKRDALGLAELRGAVQGLPGGTLIPLAIDISHDALAKMQPPKVLRGTLALAATLPGLTEEAKACLLGTARLQPGAQRTFEMDEAHTKQDAVLAVKLVDKPTARREVAREAAEHAGGAFLNKDHLVPGLFADAVRHVIDDAPAAHRAQLRAELAKGFGGQPVLDAATIRRAVAAMPKAERVALVQSLVGDLG